MTAPAKRTVEPNPPGGGMTARAALRLEYAIIGLGIFALALIFQPFSLTLFGWGCGLVVVAGLVNNLLPMCQPGVPPRSLAVAALVVANIFCGMLLAAIPAAHLYGAFFVIATAPDATDPFYLQTFYWGIGLVAAILGAAIWMLQARKQVGN